MNECQAFASRQNDVNCFSPTDGMRLEEVVEASLESHSCIAYYYMKKLLGTANLTIVTVITKYYVELLLLRFSTNYMQWLV